jgi:hypothetical protein
VIEGEARRDPSRFSAGLTELGDNVSDGLVVTDVPARGVTPGIPGDLLGWPPGQIMLNQARSTAAACLTKPLGVVADGTSRRRASFSDKPRSFPLTTCR